jgi:hypothetical protein
MREAIPSIEQWSAIYDAAIEFQKIRSWEWMADDEIFGVQNPQTGEIGYCCVMGSLGEFFGLAIYLGTSGLNTYLKMQSGEIGADDPDLGYVQNCLVASYDDRGYLTKEDLKIIKQLGLKFRGRNAWPLFRNYKPGYYPWYLNRDEVLYLTQVLKQAKDVCLRFKEDKKLLRLSNKNLYLVRMPEVSETGLIWRDKWLAPVPLAKDKPFEVVVDEFRIQRIKKSAKSTNLVWEVDLFFAPTPIEEKGRPYFPYTMFILDHNSGVILGLDLMHIKEYEKGVQEKFLSFIEKTLTIPSKILVRREEAFKLLEPFGTRLNFKLNMVKKLPCVDKAREGMMGFLGTK